MRFRKLLAAILAAVQVMGLGLGLVSAAHAGEMQEDTEGSIDLWESEFPDDENLPRIPDANANWDFEENRFDEADPVFETGFAKLPAVDELTAVQRTTSQITQIVEDYLSQCDGRYWNANITSTATLKQMVDNGDYLGATTTHACSIPSGYSHLRANGCTSNNFTGVSRGEAQCWGFADYMEYVIFRTTSSSDFNKTTGYANFQYDYQPGDLIHYYSSGTTAHTVVVYKVEGDNISIIECNWNAGKYFCIIGTRVLSKGTINGWLNSSGEFIMSPSASLRSDVTAPPDSPANIRSDKKVYNSSESIDFYWDPVSTATEYWVYLWKDGVQLYSLNRGNNTTFTSAPTSVGDYTLIVRAGNSCGYSNGGTPYQFIVTDDPPESPANIRSEKARYTTSEYITFYWDPVRTASEYWVYLWKDGVQLYSLNRGDNTSFTSAPTSEGNYTLIVRAGNSSGFSNGGVPYQFVVSDEIIVTDVALNITSKTLNVGEAVTLVPTITPSNATNKSVTWSSDAAHIASVSSDGTVTAVAPGTAAITVTTNSGGKTASCAVTVLANDPLTVTNPSDQTVNAGTKASFTVTASGGTEPYSYQWQYRKTVTGAWTDIVTAGKAQTYTLKALERHNGYQYRCVVTDNAGQTVTSDIATLTVGTPSEPLTVSAQPADQTVAAGTTVSFTVTASGGTAPYTYQWQYRKTETGAWTNVFTAGKAQTYTLTAQARHNGYQYRCVITDNAGQTVTSDFATLMVGTPPEPLTIAAHPEDQTVEAGSRVSFTVTASGGTEPYSYQWQYRKTVTGAWTDVVIAGKAQTYTLTAQARHNGYQYRCVVTDNAGQTVTSDIATLTVGTPSEPLTVSAQPADQTVAAGTTVSFTVTASGGTAPYTYQWQYRKTETGAWTNVFTAGKAQTYTLTAETRHNGYQYQCLITDAAGHTVLSGIATLTVGSVMTVANEPADVTVAVGETAVFRVSVSGGAAPYQYQWQYLKPNTTSWINVSSASGKTAEYSLKAEARHNGYQYRCAVTDSAGSTVMTKTVLLSVVSETPLAVVSHPEAQNVSVGETARFSVEVSGGKAPYKYQWQYLKPDASAWVNVTAASGKTAEYTLTAQARHDGYIYRCRITDAAGASVTSRNAVLMVGNGQNKIADLVAMFPDYGADLPVLDLTAEEEVLWDLGELNEADLPVLPMESSFIGFAGIEEASEAFELTADFNDESAAFWGDLSVYDFDEAVDGYEAE